MAPRTVDGRTRTGASRGAWHRGSDAQSQRCQARARRRRAFVGHPARVPGTGLSGTGLSRRRGAPRLGVEPRAPVGRLAAPDDVVGEGALEELAERDARTRFV